jgi:hypothetical protein
VNPPPPTPAPGTPPSPSPPPPPPPNPSHPAPNPTPPTTLTTANTTIACRRLRHAFGYSPLRLLNPEQAQKHADAFNAAHPADAVAKRFDDVGAGYWYADINCIRHWIARMEPEARLELFAGETLMGWFVEECGDDADADGDFMSTPGCSGDDDFDDIMHDIENCSRAGLLMVEVPSA